MSHSSREEVSKPQHIGQIQLQPVFLWVSSVSWEDLSQCPSCTHFPLSLQGLPPLSHLPGPQDPLVDISVLLATTRHWLVEGISVWETVTQPATPPAPPPTTALVEMADFLGKANCFEVWLSLEQRVKRFIAAAPTLVCHPLLETVTLLPKNVCSGCPPAPAGPITLATGVRWGGEGTLSLYKYLPQTCLLTWSI